MSNVIAALVVFVIGAAFTLLALAVDWTFWALLFVFVAWLFGAALTWSVAYGIAVALSILRLFIRKVA